MFYEMRVAQLLTPIFTRNHKVKNAQILNVCVCKVDLIDSTSSCLEI